MVEQTDNGEQFYISVVDFVTEPYWETTSATEVGYTNPCLNIRSRFLAMPAKLSPTLAAMDGNQAAIFDEMKKAIDETLEELSDYRVAFAVEDTADERTEEK